MTGLSRAALRGASARRLWGAWFLERRCVRSRSDAVDPRSLLSDAANASFVGVQTYVVLNHLEQRAQAGLLPVDEGLPIVASMLEGVREGIVAHRQRRHRRAIGLAGNQGLQCGNGSAAVVQSARNVAAMQADSVSTCTAHSLRLDRRAVLTRCRIRSSTECTELEWYRACRAAQARRWRDRCSRSC